jgi:hypothetical protein
MKGNAAQSIQSQLQDKEEISNLPSLNLAFDTVSQCLTNQRERLNALDAKGNFVFGATTALVSTALILQSIVTSSSHANFALYIPYFALVLSSPIGHGILLIPLLVTYLIALILSYQAYKTREWERLEPEVFMDYVNQTELYTKARLFRTMIDTYKSNENTITLKIAFIKRSFRFLIAEAILLAIFLLVQVVFYT